MNKHHNMKEYMIAKKKKFLFKKTLATKIKLLVRLLLIPYSGENNKNLDFKFFNKRKK